eukprot:Opistho-2@83907
MRLRARSTTKATEKYMKYSTTHAKIKQAISLIDYIKSAAMIHVRGTDHDMHAGMQYNRQTNDKKHRQLLPPAHARSTHGRTHARTRRYAHADMHTQICTR